MTTDTFAVVLIVVSILIAGVGVCLIVRAFRLQDEADERAWRETNEREP